MRIRPKDVVMAALMLIGAVVFTRAAVKGVTYGLQHIEVGSEQLPVKRQQKIRQMRIRQVPIRKSLTARITCRWSGQKRF